MQTNEEVKSSLELLICGREDDLYGRTELGARTDSIKSLGKCLQMCIHLRMTEGHIT